MSKKCVNCGIDWESAHVTYDGWEVPWITKKCVKRRKWCEDEFCMTCALDGGHVVEMYGKGRHKWRAEND